MGITNPDLRNSVNTTSFGAHFFADRWIHIHFNFPERRTALLQKRLRPKAKWAKIRTINNNFSHQGLLISSTVYVITAKQQERSFITHQYMTPL
jgi:hypothetical protein